MCVFGVLCFLPHTLRPVASIWNPANTNKARYGSHESEAEKNGKSSILPKRLCY